MTHVSTRCFDVSQSLFADFPTDQVLRVDRHRLTVRKCRSPERAPEDPRSGGAPNWVVVCCRCVFETKKKRVCRMHGLRRRPGVFSKGFLHSVNLGIDLERSLSSTSAEGETDRQAGRSHETVSLLSKREQ